MKERDMNVWAMEENERKSKYLKEEGRGVTVCLFVYLIIKKIKIKREEWKA